MTTNATAVKKPPATANSGQSTPRHVTLPGPL